MLSIQINSANPLLSFISFKGEDKGVVEGLPELFSQRVASALEVLCERGIDGIEYDDDTIIFLQGEIRHVTHCSHTGLIDKFLKPVVQTISLLHWHFEPLIRRLTPNVIDSKLFCRTCGREQMMDVDDKCGNLTCQSHAIRREIDPDYTLPDVTERAFLGIPKNGRANEWAQRG